MTYENLPCGSHGGYLGFGAAYRMSTRAKMITVNTIAWHVLPCFLGDLCISQSLGKKAVVRGWPWIWVPSMTKTMSWCFWQPFGKIHRNRYCYNYIHTYQQYYFHKCMNYKQFVFLTLICWRLFLACLGKFVFSPPTSELNTYFLV